MHSQRIISVSLYLSLCLSVSVTDQKTPKKSKKQKQEEEEEEPEVEDPESQAQEQLQDVAANAAAGEFTVHCVSILACVCLGFDWGRFCPYAVLFAALPLSLSLFISLSVSVSVSVYLFRLCVSGLYSLSLCHFARHLPENMLSAAQCRVSQCCLTIFG